jgi:anti-anti-sigma regulatory factor
VVVSGGARLIRLLRAAVEHNARMPGCWQLLLELHRLRGERTEFERAALECALATGATPPRWRQPLVPVVTGRAVTEKRKAPRYQRDAERISLTGVLGSASDEQLAALKAFAAQHPRVNIDLAGTARLAPAAATELVALANALVDSGKVVRLLRPSPLVQALLETLELDPRVELVTAAGL